MRKNSEAATMTAVGTNGKKRITNAYTRSGWIANPAERHYYVATHNDDPPFTHSHLRLLDVCELVNELSDEHLRFLDSMVPMYIKARYPEQRMAVARILNQDSSLYILQTTKELKQWIEERLPNSRPLTL